MNMLRLFSSGIVASVAFLVLALLSAVSSQAQTKEELREMYMRREFARMQEIAEAGKVQAQAWMGLIMQQQARRDEAKRWYLQAAEQGDTFAMSSLACMLSQDGDFVGAANWLRTAAEGGDADAQVSYGGRLADGKGVEKNEREAARWYREALSRGDVWISGELAQIYDEGRGVSRDPAEAYAFAIIAANVRWSDSNDPHRLAALELKARLAKELSPDQQEQAAQRAKQLLDPPVAAIK